MTEKRSTLVTALHELADCLYHDPTLKWVAHLFTGTVDHSDAALAQQSLRPIIAGCSRNSPHRLRETSLVLLKWKVPSSYVTISRSIAIAKMPTPNECSAQQIQIHVSAVRQAAISKFCTTNNYSALVSMP